jgi:hypothetical protein
LCQENGPAGQFHILAAEQSGRDGQHPAGWPTRQNAQLQRNTLSRITNRDWRQIGGSPLGSADVLPQSVIPGDRVGRGLAAFPECLPAVPR